MSKRWKVIGGIAAIGIGFLLLFSMIGSRMLGIRGRMAYYPGMMAGTAVKTTTDADNATTINNVPLPYHENMWDMHGRMNGRFGMHAFTPFSFVFGLFRLAGFGLIAYLLLRYFRRRQQDTAGARVLDPVSDDIRVGDEIGQATSTSDMTTDDLLQAMKRLGIKKLEL